MPAQPLNPVNPVNRGSLLGNPSVALPIASGGASFFAQPPSSSGQTNRRQGDNSRQADFSGLNGFIGKIPRADIFSAAQFSEAAINTGSRRSVMVETYGECQ
jgi:hypothetical protein